MKGLPKRCGFESARYARDFLQDGAKIFYRILMSWIGEADRAIGKQITVADIHPMCRNWIHATQRADQMRCVFTADDRIAFVCGVSCEDAGGRRAAGLSNTACVVN